RDFHVTGVQTCALPICPPGSHSARTGVPAAARAAATPAASRRAPARSGTYHGSGRDPQQRALRTALGAGMYREPLLVPEPKLEVRGAVATHVLVQGHGRTSSGSSWIRPAATTQSRRAPDPPRNIAPPPTSGKAPRRRTESLALRSTTRVLLTRRRECFSPTARSAALRHVYSAAHELHPGPGRSARFALAGDTDRTGKQRQVRGLDPPARRCRAAVDGARPAAIRASG